MTSSDIRRWLWVPLVAAACGGGSSSHTTSQCAAISANTLAATGPNVLPISVDGPRCLPSAVLNEPCVSVTVCAPGDPTNCQTIDGLLLDTGSAGLRVFSQALPSLLRQALPPVTKGGSPIAECLGFADLSHVWGPVVQASVKLGGEPAVTVPIQIMDWTYPTPPSNCPTPQKNPVDAGYNGILGVQHWRQDCGPSCEANGNRWYCVGSDCATNNGVPLDSQVTNPVWKLPIDNNGVIVELPPVAAGGTASVEGELVLGIGTQPNNSPGSVVAFPLDGYGNLQTHTTGTGTVPSFLDTGSNGMFFPQNSNPALAACQATGFDGWYCPLSPVAVNATNVGAGNRPSAAVCFDIVRIDTLPASTGVSSAVGGPAASYFDFGLPFHFGRNVYVGMEQASSPLGPGPLVGY